MRSRPELTLRNQTAGLAAKAPTVNAGNAVDSAAKQARKLRRNVAPTSPQQSGPIIMTIAAKDECKACGRGRIQPMSAVRPVSTRTVNSGRRGADRRKPEGCGSGPEDQPNGARLLFSNPMHRVRPPAAAPRRQRNFRSRARAQSGSWPQGDAPDATGPSGGSSRTAIFAKKKRAAP